MLQFKISDTSAVLTLTLTELITVTNPVYKFVFTHVLTKQQVTFDKTTGEDESDYQSRYNQFTINPSVIFANKEVGEWHYIIYENTTSGEILEMGKLMLLRTTDFAYTNYNQAVTFKTYNG